MENVRKASQLWVAFIGRLRSDTLLSGKLKTFMIELFSGCLLHRREPRMQPVQGTSSHLYIFHTGLTHRSLKNQAKTFRLLFETVKRASVKHKKFLWSFRLF
ncbi:hypothetical protein DRO64_00720 [Candidatus Bathyarchaeota archaeon]|nr:MAG: hypothetical protein DRO64_00720 [Candidatus Bathyarchaeota archaeon]